MPSFTGYRCGGFHWQEHKIEKLTDLHVWHLIHNKKYDDMERYLEVNAAIYLTVYFLSPTCLYYIY